MNKLPRYSISIDPKDGDGIEKLGISQIAYTATPAIIIKGVAFDAVKRLSFKDALKGIVAGPILIPDFPIYRQDDELGEYEVIFSKETIQDLFEDFMGNKNTLGNFNLDHNASLEAPSFILEAWVTGPSTSDKSFTKYGIELPEGSIFVVSKFTDLVYFEEEIIKKDRAGFSIEGFLGLSLETIKTKIKQTKMEETKINLPDGEYKDANGKVFVVKDGLLVVAEEAPVEVEAEKAPEKEEEAVEEKLADEVIAEPVAEVAPVANADEAAIIAVVQPMFDELYKVIADLKTLVEAKVSEDVVEEVVLEKKNSQFALASYFDMLNK